LQQKAMWQP